MHYVTLYAQHARGVLMHAASEMRNGRSCGCGRTGLGEQVAALEYKFRNTHADIMPSESAAQHFRSVSCCCRGGTAETTCMSSAQPKTEVKIARLHDCAILRTGCHGRIQSTRGSISDCLCDTLSCTLQHCTHCHGPHAFSRYGRWKF